MYVAILIPQGASLPEGAKKSAQFASRLTDSLHDSDIDFTSHPIPFEAGSFPASVSLTTLHALYNVFTHLGGIDLIHNLVGPAALYCSPRPEIPLLTTFFTPPGEEVLPIVLNPPPLFFFTAAEPLKGPPNANQLETIGAEGMAEQTLSLYNKILALTRREDHRPWGYYVVLADEPDHKVKRIVVWPGKRLSLQRHRRRSEHWHIVQGKAIVTLNNRQIPLATGDSVDIPKGTAHRIQNPETVEHLVFIEVQRGDYFGEDDIERLEDDYGRT